MDDLTILDDPTFGKGHYRDNSQRIKLARIFFIIGIPLQVIEFIAYGVLYFTIGDFGSESQFILNVVIGLISLILIVIYIGTALTFIQWIHRAYNNLHLLGIKGLGYRANFAAWCWWIPVANLYIPYQLITEIWLEGWDFLKKAQPTEEQSYGFSWIGPWWSFYVISSLCGGIVNLVSFNNTTLYDVKTTLMLTMISSLAAVVSLIFGLNMFRQVGKLEAKLRIAAQHAPNAL